MRTSLPRRPALDGLRGLAVLAVFLDHVGAPGASGGFLGVDVFFVLSGFLITALLLAELDAKGRIDIRAFWVRRAKRLLPALGAMLVLVAGYALLLQDPLARQRIPGDALATATYLANWHFIDTAPGYFEQFTTPSPLLHTWSLAVEEQFYLFWPLLLIAVVSLTRRQWPAWVLLLSTGAFFLSVAQTIRLDELDPQGLRAYMGTDARAQQLLIGALLALLARRAGWWSSAPTRPQWAPHLIGASGLTLLGAAVITVQDGQAWVSRGGLTIAAVAAAGVLGAVMHPGGAHLARLLSWRPLTWLGEISYGVYVWHWPLLVILTPERVGLSGGPLMALRFLATIAVAILSATLIELPVRRAQPARAPILLLATAVVTACAVAALYVAPSLVTTPTVSAAPTAVPDANSAQGTTSSPSSPGLATSSGRAPSPSTPPRIASGSPTSSRSERAMIFLLGDSTAYNLHAEYPPAPPLGLTVRGSTQLGCELIGGDPIAGGRTLGQVPQCTQWAATWRGMVSEIHPDVSVLMLGNGMMFDREIEGRTVRFDGDGYGELLHDWLDDTITDLAASSRHVAVTTLPCLRKRDNGLDDTVQIVNDLARQRRLNEIVLEDLRLHHPEVAVIDLRAQLCPQERFRDTIDGVRVSRDGVHWTAQGSAQVWTWLAPQLIALADSPPAPSGQVSPTQ